MTMQHGPAVVSRTEAGGRCVHDMVPAWCAPCRGVDLAPDQAVVGTIERDAGFDVAVDRTVTARFDGRCALEPHNPNHRIEVGQQIGSTDVGYVCRLCVGRLA